MKLIRPLCGCANGQPVVVSLKLTASTTSVRDRQAAAFISVNGIHYILIDVIVKCTFKYQNLLFLRNLPFNPSVPGRQAAAFISIHYIRIDICDRKVYFKCQKFTPPLALLSHQFLSFLLLGSF